MVGDVVLASVQSQLRPIWGTDSTDCLEHPTDLGWLVELLRLLRCG